MNEFKKVWAAVLAGTALGMAPGVSQGLGFGLPSSRAILGERLQFQVPLRLEPGEDVTNDCLVGDVFLGDDKMPSSAVSVAVQHDASGHVVLKLHTQVAVNEPVISVYLVAGCQAKITRKFVLFVDPPEMALPTLAAEPAPSMAQPRLDGTVFAAAAAPAKRATSTKKTSAKKVAAKKSEHKPIQPSSVATRSEEGLSLSMGTPRGAPAKGGAANTSSPGGRLVLDSVESDATVVPSLRMASALGTAVDLDDNSPQVKERRAAATAMWQALNATPEQMARDRQRLVELEQRLAALKLDGDKLNLANANGLSGHAPARAPGTSWVTGLLAWLLAIALGVLGLLAYKLRKRAPTTSGRSNWWQDGGSAGHGSTLEPTDEAMRAPDAEGVAGMTPPNVFKPVAQPVRPKVPPPAVTRVAGGAVSAGRSMSMLDKSSSHENLREVSVEELIDLEQQAEFFVVLGQDDAAISLLESHVTSTTGASPLPFLKLLEIYQRLGKREDYERVQGAFNKRFNAYAPAWESDLQQGHSLIDYPGVVERLQALWATPVHAMEVLEKSLTRPDDDAETFDLPAYRELLFLYAVARDLSERESKDRQSVDLLLPMTEASHADLPSEHEHQEVAPLMATRPVKTQAEAGPSLSLDLHLDDLNPPQAAQGAAKSAQSAKSPIITGPNLSGPDSSLIGFEHTKAEDNKEGTHKP